jgi:hypothetical protein
MILVAVLLVGGYVIYQEQQNDITIELPGIDIR